jgi:Beta-galactosidase trimerisation domain
MLNPLSDLNRRDFIRVTGFTAAGLALSPVPIMAGSLDAQTQPPTLKPPLNNCLRRINLQTGSTDLSGLALLKEQMQSGVLDCDCDYWLFATQVMGYCNHPTQIGRVNPGIEKTDPVGDMVKVLREKHPRARLVAYMHPRTTFVLDRHPEWRAINAFNGSVIDSAGPVGCLGTGIMDGQIKPYLKELLDKYDFDGFWFDGGILNHDECGCAVCRKAFETETSMKFPTSADRDHSQSNYRRWMEWRLPRHERHYDEIVNYVRAIKPTCTVQLLLGAGREWLNGDSRPASSESLFRRVSETSMEYFWHVDAPGNPLYTNFACQMSRGLSGRLAEGWTPPTCHGTDGVGVPSEELMARVWTMLANGVVPQIPVGGWGRIEDLQQAYREIKARQKYLTGLSSLKFVGLVMGENNDLAMPKAAIRAGLVPEIFGVYRMLIEEHLPVDVLGEINLEQDDLSAYKALVLPEYYVLGDKAAAKLREFVRQGGGLVSSGRTGLFDSDGSTRSNFSLADLLGANYVSFSEEKDLTTQWMGLTIPAGYFPDDEKLHHSAVISGAGMGTGYGKEAMSFWGNVVVAKTVSGKEMLTLRRRDQGKIYTLPFLVRNTFGKGRVSYLPARIGQSYDRYSYPALRRIVANELEWVAGGKPPVHFEAPLCVQATCWTQPVVPGKTRLVIQLLNETTGQGRADVSRGAWPIREETTKIADIRIHLDGQFAGLVPVTRPEGKPLDKDADGAYILPSLGLYQMITVESR